LVLITLVLLMNMLAAFIRNFKKTKH